MSEPVSLGEVPSPAIVSLGVIVNFESPNFVDMVALAGFDFVLLDAEHGPLTPSSCAAMIRAAKGGGVRVTVRTPGIDPYEVQRYLDLGADCIQAQANTAAEASELADCVFYSPKGRRGLSVSTPAAAYGVRESVREYVQRVNKSVAAFVTIETPEAVGQIAAIAACPHLSGVSIGTGDLSFALGFPGDRNAQPVSAAVREIIAACRRAGIEVMIPAADAASAQDAVALGATGIQFPASSLVIASGKRIVSDLRARL